jgi:hypothetical protein
MTLKEFTKLAIGEKLTSAYETVAGGKKEPGQKVPGSKGVKQYPVPKKYLGIK